MNLVNPAALFLAGAGRADRGLLHPQDPAAAGAGLDAAVLAADLRGEEAAVALAAAAALALAAPAAGLPGASWSSPWPTRSSAGSRRRRGGSCWSWTTRRA